MMAADILSFLFPYVLGFFSSVFASPVWNAGSEWKNDIRSGEEYFRHRAISFLRAKNFGSIYERGLDFWIDFTAQIYGPLCARSIARTLYISILIATFYTGIFFWISYALGADGKIGSISILRSVDPGDQFFIGVGVPLCWAFLFLLGRNVGRIKKRAEVERYHNACPFASIFTWTWVISALLLVGLFLIFNWLSDDFSFKSQSVVVNYFLIIIILFSSSIFILNEAIIMLTSKRIKASLLGVFWLLIWLVCISYVAIMPYEYYYAI